MAATNKQSGVDGGDKPADVIEAIQALEVDVQHSRGNYEPIGESEAELMKSMLGSSAGELGLIFEPKDYRRDANKTDLLSIPKQGIKRSNRGTIEAVFQPTGTVVEAQYNRCGILIEVSVAGAIKLTRSAETGDWSMSYCDGTQPVNKVNDVGFDRLGNLSFSSEDGHMTMICADGSVVQK